MEHEGHDRVTAVFSRWIWSWLPWETSSESDAVVPSDADQHHCDTSNVAMDLRGSTFRGPTVACARDCTFNCYMPAPSSEEEEDGMEEIQEECRQWSQWMLLMDALEVTLENESGCEQLKELLLSVLTDEEREDVKRAQVDDRMTSLLVILRRRKDLETEVRTCLHRAGVSLSKMAIERLPKLVSAVLYDTRLRLAVRHVGDLEELPDSTLSVLRDVGCLSRPEYRQVKDGERSLTSVLLDHHTEKLHRLHVVLLRRHDDIYQQLFDTFLRVQLSSVGHFHHNVPTPPQPCVPREAHEDAVRKWMRARVRSEPSPSILLLHGIGGGGKSCLASKAACEALVCGFHRVLWLDVVCGRWEMLRVAARHLSLSKSVYLGNSEETLRGELRSRMQELRERGERMLLIIDDVIYDDDLAWTPHYDAVLVTSRVKTVGCCCEDAVSRSIEGLSPAESEHLLRRVVRSETLAILHAMPGMWTALQDVCTGGFHMPLTVKIVGGLVQREQAKLEATGAQYLNDMKERLVALRTKLKRKPLRPHSGRFFEHENVYAAIYLSVERLSASDRGKFERLSVFERGETISPITMATMWSEAEGVAEELLEYFVTCSLLSDRGYTPRRKLFVLHGLIHDLLGGFISDEQRGKFCRDVVAAYSDRLSSVDPGDVFFSLRFVGLCLRSEQAEVGARCLCRLSYNMGRIKTRTADGLLLDFATTCARLTTNETLASFYRLMKLCLPIAIERNDADVVLRAAIARHHQNPFREAEQIIKSVRRRDQFFVKLDCPLEGQLGVKTGLCDSVTIETSSRRYVRSLRWDESFHDFVVVVKVDDNELEVYSILHRRLLIRCRCDDEFDRASLGGQSVVCFHVGDNILSEWYISDSRAETQMSETLELPDGMTVMDACHSVGNEDLYALCWRDSDGTSHLLRKESGRLRNVFSMEMRDMKCRTWARRMRLLRLWVCDASQVIIFFYGDTIEIWSLEGVPLKRFVEVQGTRISDDGRRLAVWTESSSIPMATSVFASSSPDASTSLTSQASASQKKKKEGKRTGTSYPEHPTHPHWQEDEDSLKNLIVLDLGTQQVDFKTAVDNLASVCFSSDGAFVFLTSDSVHVASMSGGERQMTMTRNCRWSGGRLFSSPFKDRFGRCPRQSVGQLLFCSTSSFLVQTADGLLTIDAEKKVERVVWDWRFVENRETPSMEEWAIDPHNSAIAFTLTDGPFFCHPSRIVLLKMIYTT